MVSLVRVSPGPLENWINLAQTIRAGEVGTPVEDDMAGFYGPLVQATFATQHRVASRLGLQLGWQRIPNLHILDLGAGCAPWAIAVLEQSLKSTAVVNDLPELIGLAETMIEERGLSTRTQFRAGSFHDIALEAEAFDLVALGHVCRSRRTGTGPNIN